ncbi:putative heavy metal-associated domain, HMA [Medicago truncatula]|uniref:Putative heavy metal-associated domain, HMA n=1 Tax=Medicago truncatula TaxID=3880 RepID=I3SYC3_MEDTR|nr:uncharacterized protein LOC25495228 [Medicago truncatula]AFK45265.1 unknown [Medicago truncatula]KEH24909.1 hypothetical protein MTR_6g007887 [Medicago truncatula]RHN49890.1 putative heavy metal-associated domain, HMA [Medicago truncatula]
MATLLSSSSLHSIRLSSSTIPSSSSTSSHSLQFCNFPCHPRMKALSIKNKNRCLSVTKAVEDETQQEQEQVVTDVEQQQQQTSVTSEQPSVVVPISPSDTLTMLFQAEGTLNETAVPPLRKALEETEGVKNLKVNVFEGLATLELEKQTTIQATGVASSLVEIIQGLGFKLQTLNLSFDDEDAAAVDDEDVAAFA